MLEYKESPDKAEDVKELLIPIVRTWFFNKFKEFSLPQLYGVSEVHKRQNILVSAQTGTGKTLTSFLAILNELIDLSQKNLLENKIYCIYISPLKALGRDIKINLLTPLEEMEKLANKKLGIRVAVRTGDTTITERAQMLKTTPHILITTPESLALILSSPKFAENLKDTTYVIIDEIHSIAENKRGVHLSLSLERLQRLSPEICRIGLSATVAPLDQIAQFLVGSNRNCKIIDISGLKKSDLEVLTPTKNLIDTTFENLSKDLYNLIDQLIQKHKTTLIFTNTRAGTERVVHHLKERFPKHYVAIEETTKKEISLIGAHHGSLSKEHRFQLEDDLRKGKLKTVVCLDGKTEILNMKGNWVRIKDIKKEFIQTINNNLKLNKNEVITKITKKNKDKLIKLKTGFGKEITCTYEHKFLTISKSGNIEWKEAQNLKEGGFIATIRNYSFIPYQINELTDLTLKNYPNNKYLILKKVFLTKIKKEIRKKHCFIKNFWKEYLSDICNYSLIKNSLAGNVSFKIEVLKRVMNVLNIQNKELFHNIKGITSGKNIGISPKIKINSDLMRLLGFMAAEGYLSNSALLISNRNKKVLQYYENLIKKLSGRKCGKKTGSTGTPIRMWQSVFLVKFLESLGFKIGRKSRINNIPKFIFRLNQELVFSYLSGYFDGDGYLEVKSKNNRVYAGGFCTTSKEMTQNLQRILLRENISSSIRSRFVDQIQIIQGNNHVIKKKGIFYEVTILGGEHLRKFATHINPVRENLKRIREILPLIGHCNRDVIPNVGGRLRIIRKILGISNYMLKIKTRNDLTKFELGNRNISRNKLRETINMLNIRDNTLNYLANSDLFWEKIKTKEIVKPTDFVYNIEVKNDHNYIANGFLTKNCSTSLELGIDIGYIDLVICLGSPKSVARLLQRCLPYDARLLLANGTYRKIGEIVESKLDVEVLSYDIKKGFVKSRIKDYHKNRVEELLKINFHSGLDLDITPEHPIFTREGWKNAKELKIGDEVAELFNHQISYSPYIHGLIDQKEFYVENRQGFLRDIVDDYIKKSKLKYTTLASAIGINQNRLQDYIRRKGRKKSIRLDLFLKIVQICEVKKEAYLSFLKELKSKSWHRIPLPLKLTKDFMWLAGIVASDGAITENKKTKELKIKISNKDKNLLEECQKIFNRFGFYPSILKTKNREAYSLDCGSKLLANLMLSLGIKKGKAKSHYIEVSDVLIRLPRELAIPYIEGVFEGDGNKNNNIRIFTASQRFAIGLHNLLNRLGIQNYFTHNEAKVSKLIKKINSNKIFCIYILRNNQVKTFLRYCIFKGKKAKFLLKKKFSHSLKEKDIEDNINWVKVSSTQKTRGNNQVYNITLQNGINTYFVESILTHNCGRSGHKLHEITKGRLIVLDRDDLVECSVMLKSAIERKIDKVHIPTNCLDVLAQQIIGISINEAIDVEELYLLIKQSYCYKDLSKYDFLEIIKYLAGEYTTLEDRHVYARIWFNEGKIGKRGKMARVIYMTNIGTIPDQTGVKVKHKNNFIGTIDESFLEKLERGDIFVLGGNTYQFLFARGMTAEVIPAPGKMPTVPSWFSEMLPLSFDLALEIQRFRKLMSERMKKPKEEVLDFINEHLYTKKETSEAIYDYFLEQFKFLEIPNEKKLILEEYRDDDGKTFVIVHSLYGRRVNDCLSRCLAYIILRTQHIDVEVGINDNGFYLSGRKPIKIMKALRILKSENIKAVAEKAIDKSEILKRRFRHCAGRAYMILREYKGKRRYVGRQQVSSMILMSAVKRISNDFPILKEARREVLEDLMDINNAKIILKQIEEDKIEIKEKFTLIPSPFAFNLISQGISDILKAESKQEFLQRMHKMVLAKINLKK